jgi:hypothetical protein
MVGRVPTFASILAIASCAASSPQTSSETTPRAAMPHAHPSERAMTRAFERVHDDGMRCLRPGDRVTVHGAFRGSDGNFGVERIESSNGALPYAVETCVRVAMERAHVRAFTDERTTFVGSLESPNAAVTATADAGPPAAIVTPVATSAPVTGSMTIASRPMPVDLIRREADALQRCYEQACERDHTVGGHVELHLVLDAQGHITRLTSRVDSPHEDITLMELVSHCIESHVRLIQFGPQQYPGQETVVPLAFQPGGIPID